MIKELIAKAVQEAVVDMSEDVMLLVRQIEGLQFKDDSLFINFDDGTEQKVKGVSKSELMGEIGLAGDSIEDLYFEGEYLYYKLDDGKPKKVKGFKKSDFQGKDGKDGVNGKDGRDGKDGKDGKDSTLNKKEYVKIAENEVNIHNKEFDHKLLHDSHLVGTKEVDESNIDDGKVLTYNKKKNKIVYDSIQQFAQQLSPFMFRSGYQLPSQEGNTGKVLTSGGTVGSETWETPSGGGGSIAIGDSITSATAGSVLFAGASGVLQQDNANFFWDDTNNALTLGASTTTALNLTSTDSTTVKALSVTLPTTSANAWTAVSIKSGATDYLTVTYLGIQATTFYENGNFIIRNNKVLNLMEGFGTIQKSGSDIAFATANNLLLNPAAGYTTRITAGSASSIPMTVRGAASQTANLQEWQNSAGTVLASVTSDGKVQSPYNKGFHFLYAGSSIANIITDAGAIQVTYSADTCGSFIGGYALGSNKQIRWISSTGNPNTFSTFDTGLSRNAAGIIEINNGTAGTWAALRVGAPTAATIAQIIKGAASQTANLQEWQNSAGTVLTKVAADGGLTVSTGLSINNYVTIAGGANPYVSLNTNSGGNKITILGDSTGSGGRGECRLSSDSIITYSNSATSSAGADTGLSRNAAGILEVNNGTAGTYRDLKVRDIISSGIVSSNRFRGAVSTETSNATPSINIDNVSAHSITALAADITSVTITGTPSNFDKLLIRILDNGTARAITWGSSFEAKGVALPTTTVISKVLTVGFIYDTVTSKWGCVAVANES